jgi:hydroxybutyrate-dimer hydrolase
VSGTTPTERGNDALAKILAYGWEPETVPFQASHYSLATLSVTVTYANAYAKANVRDNLCGYSFGATPVGGVVPEVPVVTAGNIFSTGNGVPPTSTIQILDNNSVGGVAVDAASISPSTGKQDLNVDGALCLRSLPTLPAQHDPGLDLPSRTLRESVEALKVNGNLRGKPAIIVHGRADTLIPVNHTSRPYFALNKTVDGASRLSYIEVTNAQHFDAFIDNPATPGYDSRVVPLHVYFIRAMDAMYNHLKNGTPLPPSQVVRTTPRGGTPGAAPAISASNVPAIAATPVAGDAITFSGNTLTIPD